MLAATNREKKKEPGNKNQETKYKRQCFCKYLHMVLLLEDRRMEQPERL